MKKRMFWMFCAAALALLPAAHTRASEITAMGPGCAYLTEPSFDVERFAVPPEAGGLVVVQGTIGSRCRVFAYERTEEGWTEVFAVNGFVGYGGLSNHRTVGDNTTPIGLFEMNTPFGQEAALDGFPSEYIQVDSRYVWTDDTNALVADPDREGEHVGTDAYDVVYDYAIDMGFNKNAIAGNGSALFIHCEEENDDGTHGCVAIPREQMIRLMRLYGTYGDGRLYIAVAPAGHFEGVYESLGDNLGLSPDGDFGQTRS